MLQPEQPQRHSQAQASGLALPSRAPDEDEEDPEVAEEEEEVVETTLATTTSTTTLATTTLATTTLATTTLATTTLATTLATTTSASSMSFMFNLKMVGNISGLCTSICFITNACAFVVMEHHDPQQRQPLAP